MNIKKNILSFVVVAGFAFGYAPQAQASVPSGAAGFVSGVYAVIAAPTVVVAPLLYARNLAMAAGSFTTAAAVLSVLSGSLDRTFAPDFYTGFEIGCATGLFSMISFATLAVLVTSH